MDGSSKTLEGVRLYPHDLKKASYLFASPPNNRTVRSVAHSLQNGGLAGICTSYNQDSEVYPWERTVGLSCANQGNRVWEARVADRSDPIPPGVDLWQLAFGLNGLTCLGNRVWEARIADRSWLNVDLS
jgi:hypothetical protein